MPYNPQPMNQEAEILMKYLLAASDAKLQGSRALASGIGDFGTGIAGGISKFAQQATLQRNESDLLSGKADAMHNAGVLDDEAYSKFQAASLGAKRGILSVAETQWKVNARNQGTEQFQPSVLDLGDNLGTFVQTSRGGGQVIRPKDDEDEFMPSTVPLDPSLGTFVRTSKSGGTVIRPPKPSKEELAEQEREKMALDAKRSAIQRKIAQLQKEIDAGNVKPGPDWMEPSGLDKLWMPAAVPYKEQLKQQQEALAALDAESKPEQPSPAPVPAQQPSRQGSGGYIPGRRYGGKLYLGGDHTDPANWQ